MALNFKGQGGELRIGTRQLATLTSFWKQERRVSFEVRYVNQFAAGLGRPTAIVLPVTPTAVRIYPVVGGGLEEGAVMVDLDGARTETL